MLYSLTDFDILNVMIRFSRCSDVDSPEGMGNFTGFDFCCCMAPDCLDGAISFL